MQDIEVTFEILKIIAAVTDKKRPFIKLKLFDCISVSTAFFLSCTLRMYDGYPNETITIKISIQKKKMV